MHIMINLNSPLTLMVIDDLCCKYFNITHNNIISINYIKREKLNNV